MTSTLRGAHQALEYAHTHRGRGSRWRPPSGEAIKSLRSRLGLSQEEFAAEFALDIAALQNWEQERRVPEQAASVLLSLIEKEPKTVARLVSKIKRRNLEIV